jgi:gliding motility-associated-like protein
VGNSSSNNISVISTTTNTVVATYPGGTVPYNMAISPDGSKLYVIDNQVSNLAVINTVSGTIVANVAIGFTAEGIAVSPDGSRVYVTDATTAVVMVINTATNTIINKISVGMSPIGLGLSPDGSLLYVANQESNNISVVNTNSGAVVATIAVGYEPTCIALSPDGSRAYVTNSVSGNVSVINTANNTVVATIVMNANLYGIEVSADGNSIYVVDANGQVYVANTITNKVTASISVGQFPYTLGNFLYNGSGCSGAPSTFTITVDPSQPPSVSVSGPLSGLTTVYGTPSASENFTVSGTDLNGPISVTPPAGFELSSDNSNFSQAISIGQAPGLSNVPVYVRLAASTVAGTYSGAFILSAANLNISTIAVPDSYVTKAPLTITANDASRPFGVPNPVFTATYKGFVNGDTPGQLTALPELTTSATISSPVGEYPIIVSGAASPNYDIFPVNGTLTVGASEAAIVIPNAFTPNGDGINDFWDIRKLSDFPNCLVSVYSRYGSLVFQSRGYPKPWDGTRNGAQVPTGTYYYIIDPGQNGLQVLSGFVAVLR